jgi:hypothetical protein
MPLEVCQFALDVVKHLDRGGLLHEVQGCCATERLHVAAMLREPRQNVFGLAAFTAYPDDLSMLYRYPKMKTPCVKAGCHVGRRQASLGSGQSVGVHLMIGSCRSLR